MSDSAGRRDGLLASSGFRRGLGRWALGGLIRLSTATSRIVYEPPDAAEKLKAISPFILTCWHGQGFLAFTTLGFELPRMHLMASRHPDGQIVAGAAASLGWQLIEASGANYKEPQGTGGLAGFRQMLKHLRSGQSVAMTADIPPEPGRKASEGLALLARMTGRPIVPFNIASSRRTVLEDQWDRMQVNWPFSRVAVAMGEPVWVPADAPSLSEYTQKLATELDRTLARAFEIADGETPRT